MRMSAQHGRAPLILVAAAALTLAAGCGDSSPAATSTPAAKAAQSDGCLPNAVKNAEGGFCLVTPPGTHALPVQVTNGKDHNYGYLDGTGAGVNVSASKLDDIMTWDWWVTGYQSQTTNADRSQQEQGDLPGGGKFWYYKQGGNFRIDVITHKGDTLLTCNSIGTMPPQPTIDSCKSVRPL